MRFSIILKLCIIFSYIHIQEMYNFWIFLTKAIIILLSLSQIITAIIIYTKIHPNSLFSTPSPMSTKSIIQNLQDSQLIQIFLDFVQTFHLQYEKTDKEISYKCHEATWILASTKATGYGRTQSQAYKHALRNLLQILIEDPKYTQFFMGLFPNNHATKPSLSIPSCTPATYSNQPSHFSNYSTFNKQSQYPPSAPSSTNKNKSNTASKPPIYTNLSTSLTSTSNAIQASKKQFKTEIEQTQQQAQYNKMHNYYHNIPTNNPLQSENKISKQEAHQNNNSNSKLLSIPAINPSNSIQHHISSSYQYKKINNSISSSISSISQDNAINGSNKKIIGLVLNKSITYQQTPSATTGVEASNQHQNSTEQASYPNSNNSISRIWYNQTGANKAINSQYEQEYKQAKSRQKKLQEQLKNINNQNLLLREQIEVYIGMKNNSINKSMRMSIGNTTNNSNNQQNCNSKNNGYTYINIHSNTVSNSLPSNLTNNTNSNHVMNDVGVRQTVMKDISNINVTNTFEPGEQYQQKQQNKLNINVLTSSYKGACITNPDENTNPRPSLTANNTSIQQNSYNNTITTNSNKSKVMVPKLKLQILPNYHKKVQKSLNDSLLAVYEQKHGYTGLGSNNLGEGYQNNYGQTINSLMNTNLNQMKKAL